MRVIRFGLLICLLATPIPSHGRDARITATTQLKKNELKPFDSKTIDYKEDEKTGRFLALITATLARSPVGAVSLRIVASAVGPQVDGTLGFEGKRGANLMTAREFKSILDRRRLRIATTRSQKPVSVSGRYRAGRTGRVPIRRVRSDGSIDLSALSANKYPLELVIEVVLLNPGQYETQIIVRGQTRLRVKYLVKKDGGKILEFKGTAAKPLGAIKP